MNTYNPETITQHATKIEEATQALQAAINARDDDIRHALNAGAKPTELSRLTGLSRERIYQIKDGRR